ncbi:hypothetical protein ACFQZI_12490 [Mucilaginibacter lutimaris]|uniref:Uncharacterized protein n=1 Tax=Mucilaginibacter lutimaris TaxID=931629 RepID=A0ABW2ZHG8_9SPHI
MIYKIKSLSDYMEGFFVPSRVIAKYDAIPTYRAGDRSAEELPRNARNNVLIKA